MFSLSRRHLALMQKSPHRLGQLVVRLRTTSKQLLSALLFGNMVINILFFAVSSVLVVRVQKEYGIYAAAATGFLTFAALVLLGDILPKSLAFVNSKAVSLITAVPAFVCVRFLNPVVVILRFLFVEPFLAIFFRTTGTPRQVSPQEFRALIRQVRKSGLITAQQDKLFAEIVELRFLKVRHCLRPRVDMITTSVNDSPEAVLDKMRRHNLVRIPVYRGSVDNIIGLVHIRSLLLEPGTPLEKLLQPVHFVPEQKSIESLLEFFRKTGTDIAIVVDEFGAIAGFISLEDIAEELLGPIEITDRRKPIERIGPFRYRLVGNLSIHDWAEAFGVNVSKTRLSTVGGLVTALLGKIPKPGDTARLENLLFTVEKVRKNRIETLILTLEPRQSNA